MNTYLAFGLHIESPIALPDGTRSSGTPDVAIRYARIPTPPAAAQGEEGRFLVSGSETYLFRAEGTFLIRDGREVLVDPAAGVPEDALVPYLLGPAMAIVLHQRGDLVLHGSCVAIEGRAVTFLGKSGWGKSTTAAAFYRRGHRPFSDDLVPVRTAAAGPMAWPSFPRLKLSTEAAEALGYDPANLPLFHPAGDERILDFSHEFSPAPLPLGSIYVLAASSEPEISPLAPQEALMELVRHSFCAVLLPASGTEPAAGHLGRCAGLLTGTRIRRLQFPRSFSALPGLVRLVEQDMADAYPLPDETEREGMPVDRMCPCRQAATLS